MWKPCRLLLRSSCDLFTWKPCRYFFLDTWKPCRLLFYSRGSLADFFLFTLKPCWLLLFMCSLFRGFFLSETFQARGFECELPRIPCRRQFMKRFCKPVGLVCEIFLFYSRYLSSYWMLFSSRANSKFIFRCELLWCASWFLTYSIRLFKADHISYCTIAILPAPENRGKSWVSFIKLLDDTLMHCTNVERATVGCRWVRIWMWSLNAIYSI